MLPALFVSHGAPTLALDPGHVGAAWRSIADSLPKPDAIIVISAHWETDKAQASLAASPRTIQDFGGFPQALYRMQYPAPGAPAAARRAVELLSGAGLACDLHPDRGLDHGAWVPLQQMFPEAQVPVTQLSVQSHRGPAHALAVGQALAPLRSEGVLLLASGGIVHNLGQLDWQGGKAATPWAREFNDWMVRHTLARDTAALLDYRARAPQGARGHPTEEHLLPFYTAYGAGQQATRVDLGFDYGSLGMDAWVFR